MSRNIDSRSHLADALSSTLFYLGLCANWIPDLFDLTVPFEVRIAAFTAVLLSALLQIVLLIQQHRKPDRKSQLGRVVKVIFYTAFVFALLPHFLSTRDFRQASRVIFLLFAIAGCIFYFRLGKFNSGTSRD